jgi:hypothetical protein
MLSQPNARYVQSTRDGFPQVCRRLHQFRVGDAGEFFFKDEDRARYSDDQRIQTKKYAKPKMDLKHRPAGPDPPGMSPKSFMSAYDRPFRVLRLSFYHRKVTLPITRLANP